MHSGGQIGKAKHRNGEHVKVSNLCILIVSFDILN